MRIFHIALTAYLVFVSVQIVATSKQSRQRKCNKNNKKNIPWRLKLLRKIAGDLKPEIKLLSLKPKHQRDYLPGTDRGLIHEEESRNRHVPIIKCGEQDKSSDLLACPTPDRKGTFYCIDDGSLCDHIINCPNGEDEDLVGCMFHKWANSLFKILRRTIKKLKGKRSDELPYNNIY